MLPIQGDSIMRLGADPEVFLIKDNNFVSAIEKIGGTKHHPLQIESMPKGFTLQEDNVALEFGIPPAKSATMFVKYIQSVMKQGLSKVPEHSFSKMSCVKFPAKELEHPLAHQFGCEPDYNAWTGEVNPRPFSPDPAIRSAGGHVHLETDADACKMGQALDLFLGIPSILMDIEGNQRRALYGKAGAIRFKPYGLEYRVLSNFWIFKPKLIKWVWQEAHRAEQFVKEGHKVPNGVPYIINESSETLANYMVKEYNLNVCQPSEF